MKTKSIILLTLIILWMFAVKSAKGQVGCPYSITNNLLCSIIVSYTIQDNACVPATCMPSGAINIAPGATQTIGAACCGTGNMYDVILEVIDINGQSINTAPNSPQNALRGFYCNTGSAPIGGCQTTCDAPSSGSWVISIGINGATVQ